MDWVIPGILYAFFNAAVIFANAKYRLDANLLGIWRGFGGFLLALPFAFFVPFPKDVWFWTFAALQGLMVGYYDYKLFSASKRFGAGGTAMMTVMAIALSVFLWWLIDFKRLDALVHAPKVFIPILLAVAGAAAGYVKMSGSGPDRKTLLKYMAPAVAVLSCMTLNSKNIVLKEPLSSVIVYYMLIVGAVGGLFNATGYLRTASDKSFRAFIKLAGTRTAVTGGLAVLAASALLMVSKNAAMLHIPNPGYLNALALTSPLWILWMNRTMGIHTRVNIKAALFTLVCIGALVYFADAPLPPMPY